MCDNAGVKIAPHSLARQRSIAHLAEETGDYERVDKALSVVVKQTENSPLRDPNDYVKLTNALTETGELERAVGIIKKAKDNFKENTEVKLFAAVEAVTQQSGQQRRFLKSFGDCALSRTKLVSPESTRLAIAKTCLANGKQDEAKRVTKAIVQNNPIPTNCNRKFTTMFKDHGGADVAEN